MPTNDINFKEPHLLSGLPRDSAILVALSGGADSSALLHLLVRYSAKVGCRIVAAHVNHCIRGAEYGFEADRDEDFCRTLCDSLGVKLFVKRIDVPALAQRSGRSLEAEAREARYDFFSSLMREQNIRILATAHNADDNLETQLFNLCRGCGIDGLIGIPKTRELDPDGTLTVVRPLLGAEKRDIIAYCAENGIGYVTDSTNLEDDCTRNVIRHRIIPGLEKLFPTVKRNSQKLSASAREDSDFILSEARRFIDENPRLEVNKLRPLHAAVKKRVLMLAFEDVSNATLESVHLDSLIALLSNEKNGAKISLPDKKQASVTDGVLIYGEEQRNTETESAQYSQKLSLGLNLIANTDFAVLITHVDDPKSTVSDGYVPYASAKIKTSSLDSIYAKSRMSGACVKDGGVNKRIKKLMCDKKIPIGDRDTLPIVYIGEEAVYIPLCAINDYVKTKRGEDPNVKIQIFKKTSEA